MKAISILEWAVNNSIEFEGIGIVDVPAENDEFSPQDEEWWLNMFGGLPPYPISEGKYLYKYCEGIENEVADAEIEMSNGINIYLYKIEG